jgi:hypothetical protein
MKQLFGAALASVLLVTSSAHAADMHQLVQETQRISNDGSHITMVWWMPQAVFAGALETMPNATPEASARVLNALDDYMIFALMRLDLGPAGVASASNKQELLRNARLAVGDENIQPLAPEDLSAAARQFLLTFKPGLVRGLRPTVGSLAESIEIVEYPAKENGKPLVDPTASGTLMFTLYDKTFVWSLPLASLRPTDDRKSP